MNTRRIEAVGTCMILAMALILTMSSYAEIDTGSIIAAWLFDKDSGDTVLDSSGNDHDGETVGGLEWEDGKFGKAMKFNGSDTWVEVGDIGVYEQITFCVWAMCTGRVGAFRVIFANNGFSDQDLHHQLRPANDFVWAVGGNANNLFSNIVIDNSEIGNWHHIATVHDSSDSSRNYYIDGEPDAGDQNGSMSVKVGPARIGAWDSGDRGWEGLLDEIIIFDTILEQEDIQAIMNNGLAGVLSVESTGKLATRWGSIKAQQ